MRMVDPGGGGRSQNRSITQLSSLTQGKLLARYQQVEGESGVEVILTMAAKFAALIDPSENDYSRLESQDKNFKLVASELRSLSCAIREGRLLIGRRKVEAIVFVAVTYREFAASLRLEDGQIHRWTFEGMPDGATTGGVVTVLLINREYTVLVPNYRMSRNGQPRVSWEIPRGYIEFGDDETPEAAILRNAKKEALEECGAELGKAHSRILGRGLADAGRSAFSNAVVLTEVEDPKFRLTSQALEPGEAIGNPVVLRVDEAMQRVLADSWNVDNISATALLMLMAELGRV